MKKTLLLFIAVISLNTYGQNVETIVNDYIKAIGGQAKLDKVKSISKKITMTTKANGMVIMMESYQNVNGVIYSKMSMMGQDMVVVAFDGKNGYKLNQSMGYEDIKDAEKSTFQNQAKEMFGDLINYKESGNTLTYTGTEKKDGVDYYTLKLVLKEPKSGISEMKVFINTKTHLIYSMEMETQGMVITTKFVSYKEFGGIKFPEKTEVSTGSDLMQTIVLKDVTINPPAPDASVFVKPKE